MNPPSPHSRTPTDASTPPSLLQVAHLPITDFPPAISIPPITRPFDVTITPPGSKSLTNRALLLASLASGRSTLRRPLLDADDARRMQTAITALGARLTPLAGGDLAVDGVGGAWPITGEHTLDLGNAGTATRFLAAASLLAPPGTSIVIDGNERMRQRPIGELLTALRSLGATVEPLGALGCPPLRVRPPHDRSVFADSLTFGTTASSQFISAVLLIAPWLPRGLTVRFAPGSLVTSEPYIAMTIGLMRQLGLSVSGPASGPISVSPFTPGTGLAGFDLAIEPDASSASYFLAAAAMCPGSTATVTGLNEQSLQGDAAFITVMDGMGPMVDSGDSSIGVTGSTRLRACHVDLADMPDTAMTLAAMCMVATGQSTIRGLRTLRVKETDRLAALACELSKLGATVEITRQGHDEGLRISPPATESGDKGDWALDRPVRLDTYDDHRMAMALALIGLRRPGVVINNPACVAKTYPTFWADLRRLYP